jgi:hypothetical protein
MMSNLLSELRLKINIIMAGDYGVDEKDVEIANKLNEMNKAKKHPDQKDKYSLDSARLTYEDREDMKRVTKLLLEDYSFIKDKY